MDAPAADPDEVAEAIAFLQGLHNAGDWHLTAITPDGPVINRSFDPDESGAAAEFIRAHSGRRNLYVHVNRLKLRVRDRKAKKEDVALAEYVHVDIDDPAALSWLREFHLPPTAVVASGGGYNAYWKLAKPLADLDMVESINRWLVGGLDGDRAAIDVSRILRVPGTMNLPTRKKLERGRVPVMARVVDEMTDWSRSYEPDQFGRDASSNVPSKTAQEGVAGATASAKLEARDLPAALDDRIAAVARLGDDPERPRGSKNARYPSRSEAVFAVACALARMGKNASEIAGVLINPALGISGAILEKKRPAEEALRQAHKAILAVGDAWPDGCHSKSHTPLRGFQNTQAAILRLGLICRFDVFRNRLNVSGAELQQFEGAISDKAVLFIRDLVHKKFGFDPGTEMTWDALQTLCTQSSFDPICDYLASLRWDGAPRIETFLIDFAGAENSRYVRAISEIFLVAAVRRARQPGVKFDTILVLEGEQGTGKSSLLKILAGEAFYSDMDILALDQKAQMEVMEGVWIYEIGELAGMRNAEVNKVKAFASRAVDKARPAYGRHAELRPRRGILVGTTNDDQYLRDETGNRRFWPVRTTVIDLEAVKMLRDQLWAEAAVRDADGKNIVLAEELWPLAAVEQAKRVPPDGWRELLEDFTGWAFRGREQVTTRHLLDEVLKIPPHQIDQFKTRRLGRVMRGLGWEGPVTLTLKNGQKAKGYWRLTERPDELYEGGI